MGATLFHKNNLTMPDIQNATNETMNVTDPVMCVREPCDVNMTEPEEPHIDPMEPVNNETICMIPEGCDEPVVDPVVIVDPVENMTDPNVYPPSPTFGMNNIL